MSTLGKKREAGTFGAVSCDVSRFVICAAFAPGYEIISFVVKQPEQISFVVTCDRDDSDYEEKIATVCHQHGIHCFRKVDVNSPAFIEEMRAHQIDLVLLAWWPSIIRGPAIRAARVGWVNLHPSLLPYNRGKHPYYWAIVDGTPFGVTQHLIDESVDTGPILFQRECPVATTATGESLYNLSVEQSINLFKETYHRVVTLDFIPMPQDESIATFHRAKEIEQHSNIDLQATFKAGDLINIIRGRTFMNGNSAYFTKCGKKYLVKIIIEEA